MQHAFHRSLAASAIVGAALLMACGSGDSSSGDQPSGDDGGTSSTKPGSGSDGGGFHYDGGNGEPSADGGGGQTFDGAPSGDAHAPATDSGGTPAGDASAGPGPYGSTGPDTVTTSSFSVTSPNDTFTTTAYIPSGSGPFPVVILLSGFEQTGVAYAPYANRLASWGIITFLRDDPGLLSSLTVTQLASDAGYMVTTWLASTNSSSSSALHGKVDTTKIGLAGHSRGGQTALLAGESLQGKILGVFGLDPVDTSTNNVEARTTIATIGTPLAFIGETTDGTGGVAGMPCAPAADNFLVLYGDAASPAVAITAVNADHTMFEDPAHCTLCTFCTAGTAKAATVLDTSVRYLTAFFARQLLGDATVGAAFQGAGAGQDVATGTIQLVSK
jgi:dienelactone hydrolase